MWLKVLLQLREYLPHLMRLVPLLENVVATRSVAVAPAQIDLAPLNEVTESLKNDLGQVTKSHVALSKQIFEANQGMLKEMDKLAGDLRTSQNLTSNRIESLERQLHSYRNWFWALLSLMLVLMALMIALLVVK